MLDLQGMRVQLGPRGEELLVRSVESLAEDLVGLLDPRVQEDGAHHGLEAVGRGVTQLGLLAEVGAVREEHVFGEAEDLEKIRNVRQKCSEMRALPVNDWLC